jgi:hypothetical protein
VLGACWTSSLDTFLGENPKYRESAQMEESEHANKMYPGGQCAEGGKCTGGRQHIDKRIKPTTDKAREQENKE